MEERSDDDQERRITHTHSQTSPTHSLTSCAGLKMGREVRTRTEQRNHQVREGRQGENESEKESVLIVRRRGGGDREGGGLGCGSDRHFNRAWSLQHNSHNSCSTDDPPSSCTSPPPHLRCQHRDEQRKERRAQSTSTSCVVTRSV